jgi:high-affinity iron transporter
MLPSFLLSLREGLEAALVIGIVLGLLSKIKRADLQPAVWKGAAAAALVSILGAWILQMAGAKFEGRAEQIFEGVAMLLAAALLTWMILWMRRQASGMKKELEAGVQRAALQRGQGAVFGLAFLAVVREGLELALFLFAAGVEASGAQVLAGAGLGLAAAAILGFLLFTSTARLSLRSFFVVTNVLLIFFAAGLVAHGIHEFNEAGLIPALIEHVWNINPILDEKSVVGSLLAALFGYNGNPSLSEVIAYVIYFAALAFGGQSRPQGQAALLNAR